VKKGTITVTQGTISAEGAEISGGCPVLNHDFSKPREVGAHWALAQELRESCPHFYNRYADGGYWVFTRHEAVRDIYKNPDLFSSESITPWEPNPIYRFVPTQVDAPDHIKYRRILNPWFSPKAMEDAKPMMREICRSYIEPLVERGRCELIGDFALRFPTAAFLNVIGVGLEHTEQFVTWVDDFFAGFGGDPDGLAAMGRALEEMGAFWSAWIDARRGQPQRDGDLVSYLLHAEFDGKPLDDAVLLDMCTVLTLAGLDTTRGELGYMFHHLAQHPEHRWRLIEEPELAPLAVEETLRYYTIIFGDGRKVTRDTEFHGVQLKRGDMVYGLVSGANRDPRHWEQADEFVIDRKRNNHFGFASGPHRCLGMHLARREMEVAVTEWLSLIPDFELEPDAQLSERGGGSMMALDKLPLRWAQP
jgi:cytochrome P450